MTELLALEQQIQGHIHVQVTIQERENESSDMGIVCVGSGRQEETNCPEYCSKEQKLNIRSTWSSGCDDVDNGIVDE